MPKKIEFALIRWEESGMTDIINNNNIKPPDREEGKLIKLMWCDKLSGKKGLHSATILKISGK